MILYDRVDRPVLCHIGNQWCLMEKTTRHLLWGAPLRRPSSGRSSPSPPTTDMRAWWPGPDGWRTTPELYTYKQQELTRDWTLTRVIFTRWHLQTILPSLKFIKTFLILFSNTSIKKTFAYWLLGWKYRNKTWANIFLYTIMLLFTLFFVFRAFELMWGWGL